MNEFTQGFEPIETEEPVASRSFEKIKSLLKEARSELRESRSQVFCCQVKLESKDDEILRLTEALDLQTKELRKLESDLKKLREKEEALYSDALALAKED